MRPIYACVMVETPDAAAMESPEDFGSDAGAVARRWISEIELAEKDMITSEGQALVQAIQALPAAFATAEQEKTAQLQSQLDAANAALAAEKSDHADDLAAAGAAVQQVAPPATAS
jgi:hypothetical protein